MTSVEEEIVWVTRTELEEPSDALLAVAKAEGFDPKSFVTFEMDYPKDPALNMRIQLQQLYSDYTDPPEDGALGFEEAALVERLAARVRSRDTLIFVAQAHVAPVQVGYLVDALDAAYARACSDADDAAGGDCTTDFGDVGRLHVVLQYWDDAVVGRECSCAVLPLAQFCGFEPVVGALDSSAREGASDGGTASLAVAASAAIEAEARAMASTDAASSEKSSGVFGSLIASVFAPGPARSAARVGALPQRKGRQRPATRTTTRAIGKELGLAGGAERAASRDVGGGGGVGARTSAVSEIDAASEQLRCAVAAVEGHALGVAVSVEISVAIEGGAVLTLKAAVPPSLAQALAAAAVSGEGT
jgi:hypothetical protein